MPFTPRLAKPDPVARVGEALDVAHRHARRDDECRPVRQRGNHVARSAPRTAPPNRRATCRGLAAPGARPRSIPPPPQSGPRLPASRPQSSVGEAQRRRRASPASTRSAAARVEPCAVGVDDHLLDVGPSQPCAALLVSGAPTRMTRSGRCAAAKDGTRAGVVRRDGIHRPERRPDSGSASTGQPATAAKRCAVSGPLPRPSRRRAPSQRAPAERPASGRRSRRRAAGGGVPPRSRPAVRTPGRVDQGSPVGTSGSRNGRLRCTGPAGGPRGLGTAAAATRPPGASGTRPVIGCADLAEPPHRVAVELQLVDGLARARIAQLRRPVGGAHDERHPCVTRLQHRGMEVRGGGARGAQHDGRAPGHFGCPQREERRGSLVEVDVQPDPVVGGQGQRQGRGTGSGRECSVPDSGAHPFVDECAGQCGVHVVAHARMTGCERCWSTGSASRRRRGIR